MISVEIKINQFAQIRLISEAKIDGELMQTLIAYF